MRTLRDNVGPPSIGLAPARRWAVAIVAVGLLVPTLGPGQAEKGPPPGAAGKLILFDGKSLDGWKKTEFPRAGEVVVEDGKIVMKAGGSMTGVTTTRRDIPRVDYELSYEAMRTEGADFFAAATFPVGEAHITLVNGGWGGNVTGLSSLNGMDASENETTCVVEYANKTWYRFRVRVTGRAIRCWVDDKEVVAVDYRERTVNTRIEVRANEPLGFATWHTGGALRKVEVRALTPDEIAAANKVD